MFRDSDKITNEFVAEHIEDIQKMAKGDAAALERIQDAIIALELGD
jgi:hypothetical protein